MFFFFLFSLFFFQLSEATGLTHRLNVTTLCLLQNRQAYGSSPEPTSPEPEPQVTEASQPIDTENLAAFFSGLMNQGGAKA